MVYLIKWNRDQRCGFMQTRSNRDGDSAMLVKLLDLFALNSVFATGSVKRDLLAFPIVCI